MAGRGFIEPRGTLSRRTSVTRKTERDKKRGASRGVRKKLNGPPTGGNWKNIVMASPVFVSLDSTTWPAGGAGSDREARRSGPFSVSADGVAKDDGVGPSEAS